MVALDPADVMVEGHRPRTVYLIERVVEYAEDSEQPFTITECWRACYGHYSMVSRVIRSMRAHELLVVTNPGRSPMRLIRADRYEAWKSSAEELA